MHCISIESPPFLIDVPQVPSEATSRAWQQVKQELKIGSVLTGKVFTQVIFGVFFDAGLGFPVRMNITDFGIRTVEGLQFPEDYPALQSSISGKLAGFDERTHQIVVQNLE
jgi:ribosomal protein S1